MQSYYKLLTAIVAMIFLVSCRFEAVDPVNHDVFSIVTKGGEKPDSRGQTQKRNRQQIEIIEEPAPDPALEPTTDSIDLVESTPVVNSTLGMDFSLMTVSNSGALSKQIDVTKDRQFVVYRKKATEERCSNVLLYAKNLATGQERLLSNFENPHRRSDWAITEVLLTKDSKKVIFLLNTYESFYDMGGGCVAKNTKGYIYSVNLDGSAQTLLSHDYDNNSNYAHVREIKLVNNDQEIFFQNAGQDGLGSDSPYVVNINGGNIRAFHKPEAGVLMDTYYWQERNSLVYYSANQKSMFITSLDSITSPKLLDSISTTYASAPPKVIATGWVFYATSGLSGIVYKGVNVDTGERATFPQNKYIYRISDNCERVVLFEGSSPVTKFTVTDIKGGSRIDFTTEEVHVDPWRPYAKGMIFKFNRDASKVFYISSKNSLGRKNLIALDTISGQQSLITNSRTDDIVSKFEYDSFTDKLFYFKSLSNTIQQIRTINSDGANDMSIEGAEISHSYFGQAQFFRKLPNTNKAVITFWLGRTGDNYFSTAVPNANEMYLLDLNGNGMIKLHASDSLNSDFTWDPNMTSIETIINEGKLYIDLSIY